jgi:hypothetical protein
VLQQRDQVVVGARAGPVQQRQTTLGVAAITRDAGQVEQRRQPIRVQCQRAAVGVLCLEDAAEPVECLAPQPAQRRARLAWRAGFERLGQHAQRRRASAFCAHRLDGDGLGDVRVGQELQRGVEYLISRW